MRKILLAATVSLALSAPVMAAEGTSEAPISTGTIDNNILNDSSNWIDTQYVHFCGYHSCGDNGGGVLHRETCTPDNVFCFSDSAGHTFVRLEPSNGGVFDARKGGAWEDAAHDDAAALNAIGTAVAAHGGIGAVAVCGQTLVTSADVTMPDGVFLDGCVDPPGVLSSGNYTFAGGLQGVIGLSPSYHIYAAARNLTVCRYGDAYSPCTFAPSTMRDKLNVQSAMSGTAFILDTPQASLNNVLILGFGQCVSVVHGAGASGGSGVYGDCTNGMSINGLGDGVDFGDINFVSYLTHSGVATGTLDNVLTSGSNYKAVIALLPSTLQLVDGDTAYISVSPGGGAQSIGDKQTLSCSGTGGNCAVVNSGTDGCTSAAQCQEAVISGSSVSPVSFTATWKAGTASDGHPYPMEVSSISGLAVGKGLSTSGTCAIPANTTIKDVFSIGDKLWVIPSVAISCSGAAQTVTAQNGATVMGVFTAGAFTHDARGVEISSVQRHGHGIDITNSGGVNISDAHIYVHDTAINCSDGASQTRFTNLALGENDPIGDHDNIGIYIGGSHTGDDCDGFEAKGGEIGQHITNPIVVNTDGTKINRFTSVNHGPAPGRQTGTALRVDAGNVVITGSSAKVSGNVIIADGHTLGTEGFKPAHVQASNNSWGNSDVYVQTPGSQAYQGSNNYCLTGLCDQQFVLPTGATTPRTMADIAADIQNVKAFGAKCDLTYGSGPATLTNGSHTAVMADAIPASAIGKHITFIGPSGAFNTTISSANGSTTITLTDAAPFTTPGYYAVSASVNGGPVSGGTGYTKGDTVTASDSTVMQVAAVSAGVVTDLAVTTQVATSNNPSNLSTTGGTGTGLKVDLKTQATGQYFYGTDDGATINTAITTVLAAKSNATIRVPGCLTTVPIQDPRGITLTGTGSGKSSVPGLALSAPGASLVNMLNDTSLFGGGITHLALDGGYNAQDTLLETGGERRVIEDVVASNGINSNFRQTSGGSYYSNISAQVDQKFLPLASQYPTYGWEQDIGATDSKIVNLTIAGAKTVGLYGKDGGNQYENVHVFGNFKPTYSYQFDSNDQLSNIKSDGATTSFIRCNGNAIVNGSNFVHWSHYAPGSASVVQAESGSDCVIKGVIYTDASTVVNKIGTNTTYVEYKGINSAGDGMLHQNVNGSETVFSNFKWASGSGSGPAILLGNATAGNPRVVPNQGDTTTGLGSLSSGHATIQTAGVDFADFDSSQHMTFNGTAPGVTSNLTAATVVGNDLLGRATLGASPNAVFVLTFHSSWTNAPICTANDETAGKALVPTTVTTSAVTFTAPSSMTAGDKVSWHCESYR